MLAVVVHTIQVIGTKVPGTRGILHYEQLVAQKKARKSPPRKLGYISTSYQDKSPQESAGLLRFSNAYPGYVVVVRIYLLGGDDFVYLFTLYE